MSASDFLTRLRQKNAEINAPSQNCINPVKDFTQFVQFAPSAKEPDFSGFENGGAGDTGRRARFDATTHADKLNRLAAAHAGLALKPGAKPTATMTASEESAIRAWLALIEETDQATIAEVIGQCQRDADARNYFTGRAAAELPKPDPCPDDRRTCTQCLNLRGRICCIAQPGGLVSARRGYEPIRDVLHRCAGYLPARTI